jgi:hypothetical protein
VVGSFGAILKTKNGGVGLTDLSSQSNTLNIYPNPASTQITISTPNKGNLSILNLNGQQLLQQEITEPTTTIDVRELKSGVYFMRVMGEKNVMMGKFVKQ